MMNVYANLRVFDHVLTTTKQQKYFIHTIQVQREVKKKIKKNKKRGKKLQVKRGTKEVNNN